MIPAMLAGTVEYADCTFDEGLDPTPRQWYDNKQSDSETPALKLKECGASLHCYDFQVNSDLEW